jgi:hypothetical protein
VYGACVFGSHAALIVAWPNPCLLWMTTDRSLLCGAGDSPAYEILMRRLWRRDVFYPAGEVAGATQKRR